MVSINGNLPPLLLSVPLQLCLSFPSFFAFGLETDNASDDTDALELSSHLDNNNKSALMLIPRR